MKKQDYYFDLPPSLIAQNPLENRSDSRLLIFDGNTSKLEHEQFYNLTQFLNPGDLLVMNDSRVIPARLYGQKRTGGKVELLIERILNNHLFLTHIRAGKSLKANGEIMLENGFILKVIERQEDLFLCNSSEDIYHILDNIGHIPLPPYIERPDTQSDRESYQTVYAKHNGSVAAPTAGLHFDEILIKNIENKGVKRAFLTLHVGSGTFRPVRSEDIRDHRMHQEHYVVSDSLCQAIAETKARGNRVIAVGTTALRGLESAALQRDFQPHSGHTNIFIYPGFQFKVCDGLITNFHLPESTLLMLVSAFIGHKNAMNLYQEAIQKQYRFFSYGDTSLLFPGKEK